MDSFEALDDYLETESIITTNWLSNELAIPLTKADELLNNYILQNKNKLNTTYLVMGYDNENIFNIRLDSEDSKPVTLKRTLSKNIYSITKSNSAPSPSSSSSSSPLNSLMVHSMLKQADSLYQQDHFIGDHDSYFYNNQGMVKNPSISIKGQFERVHSEHNLQFKRSLSASGSIQGKTFVPPPKPKETLPTPAVSAAISISKPSSNTLGNSFFGRTSTIVPKPSTAPSAEVTVPTVLATKSITGEKRKLEKKYQSTNNEPTVDSDEEWDIEVEGETKKKVRIEEASGNAEANKENISTQKMEEENQDGSEDDGEEGSDDDQDEEPNSKEGEVGEKKEKKPRKKKSSKKQKIHVHGAMDNFMEDMAIEQYKQEQQLQENGIQVTRMKKVLVEKVTKDLIMFHCF